MSSNSTKVGGDYGEIRSSIDVDKLNSYLLAARDDIAITAPVAVKQFKFGQSNPTYLLIDTRGKLFVLRKKPSGELISSTAHQIAREYRILCALHTFNAKPTTHPSSRVPIPQPITLCEDSSIIGTPFYIMEYLKGRIFTNARMPEIPSSERRHYWLAAVQALCKLSVLCPADLGLLDFGPNTPYFPRQIRSLTRVSEAQAAVIDIETGEPVGPIPEFEKMVTWFRNNLPDESKLGLRIVHGDYKLDNMVFHPTEARVIGILDWELCTLGSPLADFANLVQPWSVDANASILGSMTGFKNMPNVPISMEEMEQEYCRLTRQPFPIEELTFVRSWMFFRLSIISQGIAARYARRQASSERASTSLETFPRIGRLALSIIIEDKSVFREEKSKL